MTAANDSTIPLFLQLAGVPPFSDADTPGAIAAMLGCGLAPEADIMLVALHRYQRACEPDNVRLAMFIEELASAVESSP